MATIARFVGIKGLRFLRYGKSAFQLHRLAPRHFSTLPYTVLKAQPLHPLIRHIRHISLTCVSCSEVVQFKLSDIGEGIREVSVKEWFVKEGDRVAQFENICEVQSDKASVTITSRYDGTVTKLYHELDGTALVGEPLVDIRLEEGAADDDTQKESDADSDSSSSEDEDEEVVVGSVGLKFLATPAVRSLAARHKVKLGGVTASGKKGRILKDDVFAYLNSLASAKPTAELQPTPPSLPPTPQTHQPPTPASPPLPRTTPLPLISTSIASPGDRTEAIVGMKKAMVKSMTAANNIPHFSLCDEINMSKLVEVKELFKEVASRFGIKFSYTSVFIKAASMALHNFPLLNSSVDQECKNITYKGSHNIGVAIDSSSGLVVPNIKNVGGLSVLEVAQELQRLNHLASIGKLSPADLTGGTFTLSNVGMIGGTYTKPIIFVPEVVIGALGSILKLPRYNVRGDVYPAHVMNVSWSADHRVVDGATMARFSNHWKSLLEEPASLLLHLR